jgi:putative inorganic carbon (hco3(-)) transporter
MSKMLLLWLTLYFGTLLQFLKHPMYPMAAYLIFYYAPPQVNWWGQHLPDLRYSLTASIVMVLSLVMLGPGLEYLKRERNTAQPWLLAWGANTVVVTLWALQTARSWIYTVICLKLVLLYTLIPAVVRTKPHFEAFTMIHVVGATYWGYKAWDDPKRKAGRLMEVGGPDTQNDNQAAGHLLTVIPFALLFVLVEKRRLQRLAYAGAAAFIINVFILCNSRGATVGMIVAGFASIVLAGKGRRKKLIGVAVFGALAVLYLADPEFIARQQTTANATDNSAQSRKAMWFGGIEMIKDYPFGGGGRTFHILSPRYIPEVLAETDSEERSPHNTFIQLATDWGIQGAILFFVFMFMTFRMLHQVRNRTPTDTWYVYRSLAIEVALVGTLSAGFFSSRLYGESIYWMCALAFALHRIQSTELEGNVPGRIEPQTVTIRPSQPAQQPLLADRQRVNTVGEFPDPSGWR